MPEERARLVLSGKAEADLRDIRKYTLSQHGDRIAGAYMQLIRQALKDILADPFRPGSKDRSEISTGVRSYHISLSRQRAGSAIRSPRHFILFYRGEGTDLVVSRVIHDSRDLARHLPTE